MAVTRDNPIVLNIPLAIIALCVLNIGVIAGAWLFEYAGYKPCDLCLKQRYAYYFVIPASFVAMFLVAQSKIREAQFVLIACATAFILNAALGAYHAGVEYEWWKGPSGCTSGSPVDSLMALDTTQFLDSLKNDTNVIRCDKPAWTLFGISLAGYNFFVSLGLATLALVATRRLSS